MREGKGKDEGGKNLDPLVEGRNNGSGSFARGDSGSDIAFTREDSGSDIYKRGQWIRYLQEGTVDPIFTRRNSEYGE